MKEAIARSFSILLLASLASAGAADAGTPPETPGFVWCSSSKSCLQWGSAFQATEYRVTRGTPAGFPNLLTAAPDCCLVLATPTTTTGSILTETPAPGDVLWFLVTGANICGEGSAGAATPGPRIVNPTGSCTPACMNSVKDGLETDIDCGGGICRTCNVGKICFAASDCATRRCFVNHCQPATCTDGLLNDVETDIGCGGGLCIGCVNGKSCCVPDDCQTGHCTAGVCQP